LVLHFCIDLCRQYAPCILHAPGIVQQRFVENQHCPVMLGKGFGQPAYWDLFEKWKVISAEEKFSEKETVKKKRRLKLHWAVLKRIIPL
jgi:hypothetical protein